jgi:FkbM family methyltransferase
MVLPDGRKVAHLNRGETDSLYQEIFVDRVYTPRGFPVLPPEPTIFDVGANIGLFSLFALDEWASARVYAFEPIPEIFVVLRDNLRQHPGATAIPTALGAASGTVTARYYPRYTMMSGLHADPDQDRAIVKRYMTNTAEGLADPAERAALTGAADALLATRFEPVMVECTVETVAQAASRLGADRIDLLKVDAERAELDVLRGVGEELWPRVGNVVVEAEDGAGQVAAITDLLARQGLRASVIQVPEFRGTALHMIYASR